MSKNSDVEKEALRIARDKIEQSLKSQGYKLEEIRAEKIDDLAAQLLQSFPKLREIAIDNLEYRSDQ